MLFVRNDEKGHRFLSSSQILGGKVTNIEYGNIDNENVNIESGNIEFNFENGNIDSKTGSKRGPRGVGGGGPPADDDRGCYDPVWLHGGPRFTVDVAVFEVSD